MSPIATIDAEWVFDAACRGSTDLFFAPDDVDEPRSARRRREAAAKAVCRECTVRLECLTEAMGSDERFGIWGGLTERERRALRRGSGRAVRSAAITRYDGSKKVSPHDIAGPGRLARLPAVVVQGRAMSSSDRE